MSTSKTATTTTTTLETFSDRVAVLEETTSGVGRVKIAFLVTLDGNVIRRCGGVREELLEATAFAHGLVVGLATR